MAARQEYRLSDGDFAALLEASKPVMYIVANGTEPVSPYDRAMRLWAEIGQREGFDHQSVEPVPGKDHRYFTATPKSEAA